MVQTKIDYRELDQMLKAGKPYSEIAKRFGVTKGRISQAKKELRNQINKVTTLEKAGEIVGEHLDVMAQLRKINLDANALLDLLMAWQSGDSEALRVLENQVKTVTFGKGGETLDITEVKMKDPRELSLKCMSEIRNQLKLQMEIWQAYLEWNDRKAFQDEVLRILDEFEPGTRQRVINRLKDRAVLRGAVAID
jgi:DNA-binding transcriptional regulator GbsR (MarR family)